MNLVTGPFSVTFVFSNMILLLAIVQSVIGTALTSWTPWDWHLSSETLGKYTFNQQKWDADEQVQKMYADLEPYTVASLETFKPAFEKLVKDRLIEFSLYEGNPVVLQQTTKETMFSRLATLYCREFRRHMALEFKVAETLVAKSINRISNAAKAQNTQIDMSEHYLLNRIAVPNESVWINAETIELIKKCINTNPNSEEDIKLYSILYAKLVGDMRTSCAWTGKIGDGSWRALGTERVEVLKGLVGDLLRRRILAGEIYLNDIKPVIRDIPILQKSLVAKAGTAIIEMGHAGKLAVAASIVVGVAGSIAVLAHIGDYKNASS